MNDFLKVENSNNLIRDVKTGAILSNDNTSFESYIKKRNSLAEEKKRLDNLEHDMLEIKNLLHTLIGKINGINL